MIFIQDSVISFINKIKSAKKFHKLIAFGIITVLLIAVSFIASDVRMVFNVNQNGDTIAVVSSPAVYKKGVERAGKLVADDVKIDGTILLPTLSLDSETESVAELSEAILEGSTEVCSGYRLAVDDSVVAYIEDKTEIEEVMSQRLSKFDIDGAECESNFSKAVYLEKAYFGYDTLTKDVNAVDVISNLDVVTVAVKKTEYSVPFETVTKRTSDHLAGYVKVMSAGVKGTNQKVEQATYVNGILTSRETLSDVVVSTPVNEVVLLGTAKASYSSAVQSASSGFRWPLSSRGVITAYWGDGRNHKGIDVGVPVGTNVYAVKGGVVVGNSYSKGYGYSVTIDHGNGVMTRYAHNSYNIVSVGQTVAAGEVIALSGNSGISTGPHLHFEVIINGRQVNPAPYIGL